MPWRRGSRSVMTAAAGGDLAAIEALVLQVLDLDGPTP